ncbi:phage tail assembly protein [Serratia fonticola]|uniref:phage tail assembly protein n=1 Tax=Serratia fonticola TaxID=47917 RepID=UPI00301BAE72
MDKPKESVIVTLDTPLIRGDNEITQVELTRPKSGALRGTTLADLMSLDVSALCKVLPRISSPALTPQELNGMNPSDLVQLGTAFLDFLLSNSVRENLPQD